MSFIDYGKVVKSHGLTGGLKVVSFSGDASALKTLGRIFIKTADSEPEDFEITERRIGDKSAVVKLSGVNTKEGAERLRGSLVLVSVSDLPETGEGEYYNFQLVGLRAVCAGNGEEIGRVESVLQSGFQSVLVISKPQGELLVPLVEKFVKKIDVKKGTLAVGNMQSLG